MKRFALGLVVVGVLASCAGEMTKTPFATDWKTVADRRRATG
jgi:hypothetical protein